jgi:DNA-binding winged helix-turn-helix (wHTH) protein
MGCCQPSACREWVPRNGATPFARRTVGARPVLHDEVSFGWFQVSTSQRHVSRNGVPVALGGRAFDLLKVLLEQPGEVVTKEDLTRRVRPGVVVVEVAVRVQMSDLRRALGVAGDSRVGLDAGERT